MSDFKDLQNKESRKPGRPKGSLSGPTRELFLKCEQEGVDVFYEILQLCKSTDIPTKIKGLEIAIRHLYPTLKAVEISGEIDMNQKEREVKEVVQHLKLLSGNGQLVIDSSTKSQS